MRYLRYFGVLGAIGSLGLFALTLDCDMEHVSILGCKAEIRNGGIFLDTKQQPSGSTSSGFIVYGERGEDREAWEYFPVPYAEPEAGNGRYFILPFWATFIFSVLLIVFALRRSRNKSTTSMTTKRRRWQFVKLGGLAASVLLIALWAMSTWIGIGPIGMERHSFAIVDGVIYWSWAPTGSGCRLFVDYFNSNPVGFERVYGLIRPGCIGLGGMGVFVISGVFVPIWAPLLFCWMPTLIAAVVLFRLNKRNRHGFCMQCGYDVRANTNRCSECGTVMTQCFVDKSISLVVPSVDREQC